MRILGKVRSGDGATKYLLGLDDGMRVEAVFREGAGCGQLDAEYTAKAFRSRSIKTTV